MTQGVKKEVALHGGGGGTVRDIDVNNSIQDTLASVTSLNYLGIILLTLYDVWKVLVHNLSWSQQKWARVSSVLSRVGADA